MLNSPNFKSYNKGKLSFINIKAEKAQKGYPPLFNYNNKQKLSSENVGREYYKIQGYNAEFTENDIWNSFFHNLIYRNIEKLYELDEISTKNKNLFDEDFYLENKNAINKILNSLIDINIREYIENNYKNSSNELTNSRTNRRLKVLTAAEHLENNQILIVMEYMIKDYIHNRRGFPDLMVWNDEEIFFSEIKAGSDILSRRQIKAHKILQKAGINVVLLTINKNESEVNVAEYRYTKKRKPAKTDYKGRYALKLEKANDKSEDLKEYNSEEVLKNFKTKFYDKNLNYFIAYMNVLDKENINNLEEINIDNEDLKKEEELIKYLSIMSEAKALEEKKMIKEAIEKYKETAENPNNPRRLAAFYRMCICYGKKRDWENELAIIKKIVNDDTIPKDKKRGFKRRIEKTLKNQEYITSDISCPKCGEKHLKYKIHKTYKTKLYKCENCKYYMID